VPTIGSIDGEGGNPATSILSKIERCELCDLAGAKYDEVLHAAFARWVS
jgi:hypothetical protein